MKVDVVLKAKGREVETVQPDAGIMMVLHKLTTMGIGAVVVSSDGQRVDGLIAERNIVRELNKHGARLLELSAAEVMSKSVPVCAPEDSLRHAMQKMTTTRQRHLPVVDGGKLCGLVSIGDIVKNLVEEVELEDQVLRDAYLGATHRRPGP